MKKVSIEIKWAIMFTIAYLCWILFEKIMGWENDRIENFWWLTLFFTPFAIFFFILAMREKRRRVYHRNMTWKQGFLTGLVISLFVALLSPITEYISYNFFTPENFNAISDSSVTNKLVANTKMNDILNIDNYRWQSAFGLLGLGIIISAISAIFTRREEKNFETAPVELRDEKR